jgi:hypothetical protein
MSRQLQRWTVTLTPESGDIPMEDKVRRWLKRALRGYQLRAEKIWSPDYDHWSVTFAGPAEAMGDPMSVRVGQLLEDATECYGLRVAGIEATSQDGKPIQIGDLVDKSMVDGYSC